MYPPELEDSKYIAEAQAAFIMNKIPQLRPHRQDIIQDLMVVLWQAQQTWDPDGGKGWESYAINAVRFAFREIVALHLGSTRLQDSEIQALSQYETDSEHSPVAPDKEQLEYLIMKEFSNMLAQYMDKRDHHYWSRSAESNNKKRTPSGPNEYGVDSKEQAWPRQKFLKSIKHLRE